MEKMSKAEEDTLFIAKHNDGFGWATASSRQCPMRIIRRCVAKGWLAQEPEACVAVDGDGFAIQPERYKTAYRLTDEGRRVITELEFARSVESKRC